MSVEEKLEVRSGVVAPNIRPENFDAIPKPGHDYFHAVKHGGDHLGELRGTIQRRGMRGTFSTKHGDEVTWGSHDVVAMTVRDLELMSGDIARAAILEYLEDQKRAVSTLVSRETWPGWTGEPGDIPVPHGFRIVVEFDTQKYTGVRASTGVPIVPHFDTWDEACLATWAFAKGLRS